MGLEPTTTVLTGLEIVCRRNTCQYSHSYALYRLSYFSVFLWRRFSFNLVGRDGFEPPTRGFPVLEVAVDTFVNVYVAPSAVSTELPPEILDAFYCSIKQGDLHQLLEAYHSFTVARTGLGVALAGTASAFHSSRITTNPLEQFCIC